jgi:hypothetical protein
MRYFFFYLKGLIVSETDDWWYGLEEGFVDIHIRLSIDRVVCKIEELHDSRLLVGFIEEASASQLFLYKLTRRKLSSRALLLFHNL